MSKVTLIGAGSVLWAPKILSDFYSAPKQPIDEICLMDIHIESVNRIKALAKLMEEKSGRKFKITVDNQLERSVEEANFVVTMISVGGLEAMAKDLSISQKYGVFHTVGDTVGPCGFSRLLRNVPVFKDMVTRIESVAPNAWLINLSNPLTGITKMISEQTCMKTVGLCPGILNHIWVLKDVFGFNSLSEIDYKIAGIDHCSWFLELKVNGRDIYPELREMTMEQFDRKGSMFRSEDEWASLDSLKAGFTIFKNLGYLPAIGDRHISEFFPFFLSSEENLEQYDIRRTSIEDRFALSQVEKRNLAAIVKGEKELAVGKRRGIVVDVINALAGSGNILTTINYPNSGQIDNLPRGSIVETLGRVSKNTINPLSVGLLPPQVLIVVLPHVLRQEFVLKAALEGSRDFLVAALVSDPATISLEKIKQMVDELLEAHRNLLPQFKI